MNEGNTKCEWCLNDSESNSLKCDNCGGPVTQIEPWTIQCGWCTSSNRRDLNINCLNCGGILPHIPGTLHLPKPPQAPRVLPAEYENKILYWKNVFFMIGAIFMALFFTIIFPIIGFFLIRYGLKKAKNKIYALKNGIPTKGNIKNIYTDRSQTINGKNPLKIDYTFETNNGISEGSVIVWDESNLERKSGEYIWVVYNPKNKEQNCIWPPLH